MSKPPKKTRPTKPVGAGPAISFGRHLFDILLLVGVIVGLGTMAFFVHDHLHITWSE